MNDKENKVVSNFYGRARRIALAEKIIYTSVAVFTVILIIFLISKINNIFYSLNIFWIYDGLLIAIIVGVFAALFVKYLFDYIFPNPPKLEGGSE